MSGCPSCDRDLSYPGSPGHECYTYAEQARSRRSDMLVRGSVARYKAMGTGNPVWAWVCYDCDLHEREVITGEDFGLTAAFSWSDAMRAIHDHLSRHRRLRGMLSA